MLKVFIIDFLEVWFWRHYTNPMYKNIENNVQQIGGVLKKFIHLFVVCCSKFAERVFKKNESLPDLGLPPDLEILVYGFYDIKTPKKNPNTEEGKNNRPTLTYSSDTKFIACAGFGIAFGFGILFLCLVLFF